MKNENGPKAIFKRRSIITWTVSLGVRGYGGSIERLEIEGEIDGSIDGSIDR